MLGFGKVDAAEVAFGEHDALGAKAPQILVTEIVAVEFPFGPDRLAFGHALSRAAT